MATALAQIDLDVCTYKGNTSLARLTATWPERAGTFERFTERNTSASGKTGTYTYHVPDGAYESNEPRLGHAGRCWWIVADGVPVKVTKAEALATVGITVNRAAS